MGWADSYIEKLRAGETVQFRPRGNSMAGKIESGQLVTVTPVAPMDERYPPGAVNVQQGDIVLCRVHGNQFLHLVVSVKNGEFLIGNNRGFTNGWTSAKNIYGKVTRVR